MIKHMRRLRNASSLKINDLRVVLLGWSTSINLTISKIQYDTKKIYILYRCKYVICLNSKIYVKTSVLGYYASH